jgi:hypothetical protein
MLAIVGTAEMLSLNAIYENREAQESTTRQQNSCRSGA